MKKTLIFSILATFLLTSCIYVYDSDKSKKRGIKGNGIVTKEERDVSSFDKIEISSGAFTLYLFQGDTESVEVETDENLQKYIRIRNFGNKLVLDMKDKVRIGKITKNNVYITLKSIESISVTGICDLKQLSPLTGDYFTIEASGVFNGDMEVYCNNLVISVAGVSNIDLRGSANELHITQEGVGSVNAIEIVATKAVVQNSGVGSVKVYATDELSLTNSGVGSITYSGDAKIIHLDSSGLGKIKKR